jgi:CBS domain-containing protein
MLNNKHSDKTLVKEIMTTDLPIVSFSESAEQCMVLMNAAKSRYLPVFDSTEFKGIITIHDLMREAIAYSQQNIDVVLKKKPEQHYWI